MSSNRSQKQQNREHLVGMFLSASGYDVTAAEEFDRVLCAALRIDVDKHPALFLADLALLG